MSYPLSIRTLSCDQPPEVVLRCYSVLSDEERRRADRYKVAKARDGFVLTRWALRVTLAKQLGGSLEDIEFGYGEFGKPQLVAPQAESLGFNASHSGEMGCIAVGPTSSLGIDLEQIRPLTNPTSLARSVFSTSELRRWELLSAEQQNQTLLETWTLKEACLKAVGVGLSISMSELEIMQEINPDGRSTTLIPPHGPLAEAAPWALVSCDRIDGYSLAVAVAGSAGPVEATFSTVNFDD